MIPRYTRERMGKIWDETQKCGDRGYTEIRRIVYQLANSDGQ